MSETIADDKDYLVLALREELEKALIKELGDAAYTGEDQTNANLQFERMQKTVMSVLVGSVRTQRLYFVIRSVIMGLISALMYFLVVWFLGTIDAVQAVFLGLFVFVTSLVVSRLFDGQIVRVSKKITSFLSKHKRLRTFVLKRL
jgi:hypothetical protein